MELRERVLEFVRSYYKERGTPPSMRHIARSLRISTKTLYTLFPGGVEQVYRMAGVAPCWRWYGKYSEFFSLYREYTRLKKRKESLSSLMDFIDDVRKYVKSRLGYAAVKKLEEAPLTTFNKVARLYLKVLEGGCKGS